MLGVARLVGATADTVLFSENPVVLAVVLAPKLNPVDADVVPVPPNENPVDAVVLAVLVPNPESGCNVAVVGAALNPVCTVDVFVGSREAVVTVILAPRLKPLALVVVDDVVVAVGVEPRLNPVPVVIALCAPNVKPDTGAGEAPSPPPNENPVPAPGLTEPKVNPATGGGAAAVVLAKPKLGAALGAAGAGNAVGVTLGAPKLIPVLGVVAAPNVSPGACCGVAGFARVGAEVDIAPKLSPVFCTGVLVSALLNNPGLL